MEFQQHINKRIHHEQVGFTLESREILKLENCACYLSYNRLKEKKQEHLRKHRNSFS